MRGLTTQLLGIYDQVRRMSAPQFVEYRRRLDETLSKTLFPPQTEPVRRFVMAEFEWRRFWQDRHVAELLAKLVPALPQGDAR
ncbi:MAG: hypothetical protein HYU66_15000 [Armatimonadetes bacterium]|nr:hypothetical protein [Armatimonadota bacterium]